MANKYVALVTSRIRQFFSDFICCVELTLPLLQQRVVPVTTINFVCICSFTMGLKILKTFINYLRGYFKQFVEVLAFLSGSPGR